MSDARHSLQRWLRQVGSPEALGVLSDLLGDAAVFAVDRERNIVFWSEAAERLLGFGAAEVLGSHCLKGIRCDRCMVGCGIAEHGTVRDVPLTLFRADGRPVRIRKTARAFFDPDGTFAGGIELLTPVEAGQEEGAAPALGLPDDAVEFYGLVSRDPGMKQVFRTIRNVAETEATVLVRGESGTGKELVAHALHAESHRRAGPFLAVNCAALTPSLLESELFGHVKGAFTGAIKDRAGVFQQAHGGTLFLDEVAELPLDLQAKLLRVLQERTFFPVGGTEQVTVDIRLVAATHRALREEVKAGRFREDLMYRLRVVPLFLPPLRERRGDVDLLLRHFIDSHNVRGPRRVRSVAPEAMRALLDHSWPGNVRELQNVVEYAFAVGRGPELRLDELPPEFRRPASAPAPGPTRPRGGRTPAGHAARVQDEAAAIRLALEESGGNVGEAAERLEMSRPTFWRKRKKYGI